ncbi:hypothetical protein [Leifsonia sp. EB34]|uniref:hypothetical protein n=1 Tax=Leifsonia sp. EB34 TaxID=3156303 RepID=UPI0035122BF2
MSGTARVFERSGHIYELFEIESDPVWNLFEDFGVESALVGSITRHDSQFSIECYWKPEPGARIHDIDARTLDEAVHALLDLASGEDPRSPEPPNSESDRSTREAIDPARSGSNLLPHS